MRYWLSTTNGENIFNVSVNGISGVITMPPGFYVGSTLAEALESKINQIMDPVSGDTVGGVTARFNATTNNFEFTTELQVIPLQLKLKELLD